MMDEVTLILYSTAACHLCEEAEGLLRAVQGQQQDVSWEVIDIANDDQLFEVYGWLIPVLRAQSAPGSGKTYDRELRWPFDAYALTEFLDQAREHSS